MRNAYYLQYLLLVNLVLSTPQAELYGIFTESYPDLQKPFLVDIRSKLASLTTFKPNRTHRDLKNYCDMNSQLYEQFPSSFENASESLVEYIDKPKHKNLGGWIFIGLTSTTREVTYKRSIENSIQSQLLEMELSERINEPVTFNDPFTGAPYTRNTAGLLFSVGRDLKPHTADDIVYGKY